MDFNLIIETFREPVIVLDKEGYIAYTNPAARNLLGYSAGELEGKNISIIYGEKGDSNRAEFELSMARKKGKFTSTGWKSKKTGGSFWGELDISGYHTDQGFSGYTCLLRDTSEKKEQELTLRVNEERFRVMVENIRDYSMFLLDVNGYIQTWNDGAAQMTGYSANDVIGKHVSIFYSDTQTKMSKAEFEMKTAIETGKFEEEGWRVKKNGSLFWAYVVITALYNDHNQLIGFSKVTRDLSEKKQQDELLRLSEEKYRLLVEQVTDYGIFMLDEKGRIVSWNEGARRIKGYETHEILGKYFSIFYPEEDIISGKPAYELKVAIKEGRYEEEGWRIRKDGSGFWASIVITAVYNNAGALIGCSKVTRDLTERKQAEKALRDSYERYRQLASQLKITNDELSYANEELEQFTSIVSHDLQEPVRTIKSFLQLIDITLDEMQSVELKSYITKSINAANRMKELIHNLLHYSQLSKGELMIQKVDVHEIVAQALQNLKTAIDISNARITTNIKVQQVYGDRVQLIQLIQNLISNALKFTNSPAPHIEIFCEMENEHPVFSISDNGIGIAREDLEKVFEIFRRLAPNKAYPGTGIGLAICKKIVDRHNGRIWPESQPGSGTTFYFTLNEETKTLAAS